MCVYGITKTPWEWNVKWKLENGNPDSLKKKLIMAGVYKYNNILNIQRDSVGAKLKNKRIAINVIY